MRETPGQGRRVKEAPAANPLFISSFSFVGDEKSPLVCFYLCVNHRQIRPSDWSRCFGSHLRLKIKMTDALERDREAKFEQILKEILLELEGKGRKITLKDEQRKAVKQLYGKKDLVAAWWQFY